MTEAGMRSLTGARWVLKHADEEAARRLSQVLGVSAVTARALVCRGVAEVGAAQAFLRDAAETGAPNLHDPFAMKDMDRAVAVVESALGRGARIRVYGDYDVDGVCATALLVRALSGLAEHEPTSLASREPQRLAGDADTRSASVVDWYIPHRVDEGYGVNKEAVLQAKDDGVELLITVDCGSTAVGPVAVAREHGMEVIITDHHRPDGRLPQAPVLNPWRDDCGYPFKELAGVGVAFKLVAALGRARGLGDEQALVFLDLVCLGTVGDVVPLLGENRLFVQHGLQRLANGRRAGIRALIEVSGVGGRRAGAQSGASLQVRDVAFGLAPRINAAGRMEDARAAVSLLLTRDPAEARSLAAELCAHNDARRAEELKTLEEAEKMVGLDVDLSHERVIVLASERWHPGVIGIVASRLVERYFRPVLLAAVADGTGKGSGRSIGTFNLWEGLHECADLFTRFGGHRYAAGFGIEASRLPELRRRINEVADRVLTSDDLTRRIEFDAEVGPSDLTVAAAEELDRMGPFGMGNPAPLLVARGLQVQEVSRVGDGSHLSLRLKHQSGEMLRAIWFGGARICERSRDSGSGEAGEVLATGQSVDVCFRPKVDEWGGSRRVQLQVSDIAVRGDG
jgi:single-stranded-DNA-specific exonuclease